MLDVDDLVGATRGADNLAVVVEVAGVAFLRGDSFVGRAGFTSLSLISPGSLRAVSAFLTGSFEAGGLIGDIAFLTGSFEAVGFSGDVAFFTVVVGFFVEILAAVAATAAAAAVVAATAATAAESVITPLSEMGLLVSACSSGTATAGEAGLTSASIFSVFVSETSWL